MVPQARVDLAVLAPIVQQLWKPFASTGVFIENLPIYERCNLYSYRKMTLDLASLTGRPFCYKQQNSGEVVAELRPKGSEGTGSGSGLLSLHSDDVILRPEFRPQVIVLVGVINEANASTFLVSTESLLTHLDNHTKEVLSRPNLVRFLSSKNYPFANRVISEPRPILYKKEDGNWGLDYNGNDSMWTDPEDEEGKCALEVLAQQAEKIAEAVVIKPGTALLFRNDKCLHSRAPIEGDRLIYRCYVRKETEALDRVCGPGYVKDALPLLLYS